MAGFAEVILETKDSTDSSLLQENIFSKKSYTFKSRKTVSLASDRIETVLWQLVQREFNLSRKSDVMAT